MKKIVVLVGLLGVASLTSDSVRADGEGTFIERMDRILVRQSLCVGKSAEQVKAEKSFKEMYTILKQDITGRKKSMIEAYSYQSTSASLRHNGMGHECVMVLHGGCYSVFCERIF